MEPIIIAIAKALEGVEYDTRHGAACPWCGEKLKITHTMPWRVSRVRYHRCDNHGCPLHLLADLPGLAIKSIQPPPPARK
jgi:hypothetical protein